MRGQSKRRGYLLVGLLAMGVIAGCRSEADRVTGKWQGTLDLGSMMPGRIGSASTMRLVCNIRKNSDGTLGGTLDSPDQNAAGLPIDVVTIKNGAFHLQLNRQNASYDGQLSTDGSTISGQWKQNQFSLPCEFKRSQ